MKTYKLRIRIEGSAFFKTGYQEETRSEQIEITSLLDLMNPKNYYEVWEEILYSSELLNNFFGDNIKVINTNFGVINNRVYAVYREQYYNNKFKAAKVFIDEMKEIL